MGKHVIVRKKKFGYYVEDLTNRYKKAKKGEVTCKQCQHATKRWWSGRYECEILGYAVAKNNTCKLAKARIRMVEDE